MSIAPSTTFRPPSAGIWVCDDNNGRGANESNGNTSILSRKQADNIGREAELLGGVRGSAVDVDVGTRDEGTSNIESSRFSQPVIIRGSVRSPVVVCCCGGGVKIKAGWQWERERTKRAWRSISYTTDAGLRADIGLQLLRVFKVIALAEDGLNSMFMNPFECCDERLRDGGGRTSPNRIIRA